MERRSDFAGSQPRIVFARVGSAMSRIGSPARAASICTGISRPCINVARGLDHFQHGIAAPRSQIELIRSAATTQVAS